MLNGALNGCAIPSYAGDNYRPEAKALFLAQLSNGYVASPTAKRAYNNTIIALKNANIWQELDSLYIFGTETKSGALVDVKTTTRTATLTNDYAGSFTAYRGLTGNGSNFRLDTGVDLSLVTKYTLNANGIGYISLTDPNSVQVDVSRLNGSSQGTEIYNSAGTFTSRNNGSALTAGVYPIDTFGAYHDKRTSSTVVKSLHNGKEYISSTVAVVGITSGTLKLFCRDTNGAYSFFSTKTIQAFWVGSSSINDYLLYDILNKYFYEPLGQLPHRLRIIFDGNSMTADGTYPRSITQNTATPHITIFNGISGIQTPTMVTNFATKVGAWPFTWLTKNILIFWEVSNHMAIGGASVATAWASIVDYCAAARSYYPGVKIILTTCLPRGGATPITPALRQNPLDLNDVTTINGKIRTDYATIADGLADVASNATYGIDSGGVPGVGEKNTTYYNADEIHPKAALYSAAATSYWQPAVNALI